MKHPYPLKHLGDGELLSRNGAIWKQRRHYTAEGLAHLAEIDERRLYLPAAYDTMQAFCIHELRFTPDEAEKRVTAARVARQYPVIFTLIAEGRLHITGVLILAPRLTPQDAEELLGAAADKTIREIRLLLAERFPRPDLPTQEPPSGDQLDLAASDSPAPERGMEEQAHTPVSPGRVMALSPGRFGVQFTMNQNARDHYEYARALLSHQLPQADLATVTEMAYAALVEKLEKVKFGAAGKPRSGRRCAIDRRHIPAPVRRQVLERDGGRCTFTSEAGNRCPATRRLEFDHVDEFARGGVATAENLRIRCRAHNQYAAELAFGKGFMARKRREAKERRVVKVTLAASQPAPERVDSRTHTAAGEEPNGDTRVSAQAGTRVAARANRFAGAEEAITDDRDVTPWLRELGVRASDARRMAEICETTMPDASLEERLKRALGYLAPRQRRAAP